VVPSRLVTVLKKRPLAALRSAAISDPTTTPLIAYVTGA
jgi:hypothetical protein